MENQELTTVIKNKTAILRYLTQIFEQNLPLLISSEIDKPIVIYRSRILKVESKKNQLILHQLLSGKSQDSRQLLEDIDITCYSEEGRIKFSGKISPIDDSDNPIYSYLTLPLQMIREQLRSSFRVSLDKFKSKTSLELEEGDKVIGTCKNISLAGALFYLPVDNDHFKEGEVVEHCSLIIFDILDLTCPAEVRHVERASDKSILVGLKFLNLELSQLNSIKPAMNKLERMNILQETSN